MGGQQSSEPPRAPAQPAGQQVLVQICRQLAAQQNLYLRPWREINWGDRLNSLQYVRDYKPSYEDHHIRILLYGPVGAGKSSFINSVQSILNGRMYAHALVDNISFNSFTKRYTTYKIRKSHSSFYPFVFNDIMGLDPNRGVLVDDVKLALRGRMREGYRFNPESRLSEDNQLYNMCPTENDKVHVLVCAIPADTVSQMSDKVLQKIRDIRMDASELGIPQVAILTKIDEASPEIKQDLKNVYGVQSLKRKMEQLSADVGIPMNCIFPVKNYHEEIDLDSDVDSLILSALTHIIHFGDDCLNFNKSSERLVNFSKA